jgi:hypothetical protein
MHSLVGIIQDDGTGHVVVGSHDAGGSGPWANPGSDGVTSRQVVFLAVPLNRVPGIQDAIEEGVVFLEALVVEALSKNRHREDFLVE